MSTAQELGDLIYATALQWVPREGGIAQVGRDAVSVVVFGHQPRGLRGVHHPPTCILATVTDGSVQATIAGGRPGISIGYVLFTLSTTGRPIQEIADETVEGISRYLASTTS